MSSSGDNSAMSTDKSSDESPDWDANMTPHAMSSPYKKKKRKAGTPVSGARGALLSSQTFDTALEAQRKAARKRKRNSKAAAETWSLSEFLAAQNIITPSQKRKRVSLTDVTPNRILSPTPNSELDQQQDHKKRVSFAGIMGTPKTPSAPVQQDGETATQEPKSTTRKRKSKTPKTPKTSKTPKTHKAPIALKTPVTPATTPPAIPKFPKLQQSSTYHSDIPKPTSPEPVNEGSFHDLVEENNELRMRVQTFEQLDDMILEAAAPIGAIAFSDHTDTLEIDPVRQTLLAIERPAAEACLVILDKLTEAQAGLAASRAEGMGQFTQVDEEVHRGKILMERIGLLEESNEVLGVEKEELTRLYLNKHLTVQERGQHIRTLLDTNRRFKQIQASDKETISKLQQEVEDLDEAKRELEQQKAQFAESAEVYISDLQRLYEGKTITTGGTLSSAGTPTARQSESYLANTRKAAQGLAGVMDKLNGNDYINAIIPLYPLTVLVSHVRDYTDSPQITMGATTTVKDVQTPDPIIESLKNITDSDPCKEVKILFRDSRANYEKRQREWDQLSAKQGRKAKAALDKMTEECDSLKEINNKSDEMAEAIANYCFELVEAAKAEGVNLKVELEKHEELLATSAKQMEALQTEIITLRAGAIKSPKTLKSVVLTEDGYDPCLEVKGQLSKLHITSAKQIKALQAEVNILKSIPPMENRDAEANRKFQAIFDQKDEQINNLLIEIDGLKMAPPMINKQQNDEYASIKKQLSALQTSSRDKIGSLQVEVKMLKNISLVNKVTEPFEEFKVFIEAVTAESDINIAIDKMKNAPTKARDPYRKVKEQLLGLFQSASGPEENRVPTKTSLTAASTPRETTPEDDPCAEVKKKLLELQKRLDIVRRRLKIRKKEQAALDGELARYKALEAVPSSKEFKESLKMITDKQKLSYVRRINMLYRTKQEQMFPPTLSEGSILPIATTLRDLLRQDGPPIKEISDRWFEMQWDELYDRVTILCQINYRGRSDHLPYDYAKSAAEDELLSYYLRDTVLSENAMHDRINNLAEIFGHTYRAKVAVAIVFRILVEEIFNPIRFLLNMRFSDSGRWKSKLQFKQAFEELDNPTVPRAATRRGFQERESWCTRQAAITGREVYRPSRQRDENFNFFKQIEEIDYDDNDNGKVAHQLKFLSLHH